MSGLMLLPPNSSKEFTEKKSCGRLDFKQVCQFCCVHKGRSCLVIRGSEIESFLTNLLNIEGI
jgi:hypothetical protein